MRAASSGRGSWRALPAALLAALLVSCESSPGPRPALGLEVAQYIARLKQWAPVERQASAAIAEVLRSQFIDAEIIRSTTRRVLPAIDAHVAAISAYGAGTPEIIKIHGRYQRAWRSLREGFALIDEGMQTEDQPRLAEGRRRLEAWSQEMLDVAAAVRQLADAVGVSKTNSAADRSRGGQTAVRAFLDTSLFTGPHVRVPRPQTLRLERAMCTVAPS